MANLVESWSLKPLCGGLTHFRDLSCDIWHPLLGGLVCGWYRHMRLWLLANSIEPWNMILYEE